MCAPQRSHSPLKASPRTHPTLPSAILDSTEIGSGIVHSQNESCVPGTRTQMLPPYSDPWVISMRDSSIFWKWKKDTEHDSPWCSEDQDVWITVPCTLCSLCCNPPPFPEEGSSHPTMAFRCISRKFSSKEVCPLRCETIIVDHF